MGQNLFNKMEQKGRDIFKNWCDNDIRCKLNKFSTNEFTKWDVSFLIDDNKMVGEIKYRLYNHNAFDTWIIQKDKYEFLINMAETLNVIPIYINIFEDSTILMWDLNSMEDIVIKEESYNKTFCGDSRNVQKEVIHLSINKAKKIKML